MNIMHADVMQEATIVHLYSALHDTNWA